MPQFLVDLWLDGYNNEKDMEDACIEFIEQELTMASSSVQITQIKEHNQCICEGNWRNIIKETEHLIGQKYQKNNEIFKFIGVLYSDDDFYYAFIDKYNELSLYSCVLNIEDYNIKLID